MRTLPPLPMTTLLVTTAVGVDLLAWNGDVVTAAGPALPSWAPVLATIAVHQSLWWRRSRAAPVFAGQTAFALVSLGVPLWQPVAGLLVATYAAGARGLRVTPVALALATVALGHGSVSYTHLDVYKRQGRGYWESGHPKPGTAPDLLDRPGGCVAR